MIKAIIFDCDGVLIESAHIKTEAFRKLFSRWPDKADDIVSYHMKNMGISRYIKFKYFYENHLKQPYTDEIGDELSRQFSSLVIDEIKQAPLVTGTKKFLETHHTQYLYFIASGTPQEELIDIVSTKGIDKFFAGIYGTPPTKMEIVRMVMATHAIQKDEIVFIGDASSDKTAAAATGIHFILRLTGENDSSANDVRHTIRDLTQLKDTLEGIAQ